MWNIYDCRSDASDNLILLHIGSLDPTSFLASNVEHFSLLIFPYKFYLMPILSRGSCELCDTFQLQNVRRIS